MGQPPHDEQAERFALGYAMLFGIEPMTSLRPEHFFFDANRLVFSALSSGVEGPHGVLVWLLDNSTPLSVTGGRGCDLLLRVGGGVVLSQLVEEVPSGVERQVLDLQASACADSVKEHWRRRKLVDAMREIESALHGDLNSQDAWTRLKAVCAQNT